jgi:tRNA (cmo5U34)-methyltransferase
MPNDQSSMNLTSYHPAEYDDKIIKTIPYYLSIHRETINFVKALSTTPSIWLDTGCGTGSFVRKAIVEFPNTIFFLLDPSNDMIQLAQEKLASYTPVRLEFLKSSTTQELVWHLEEKPDVITAIQCHHYLDVEGRIKATEVCYNTLKEGGVYITFENIRPLTEKGIEIIKQYVANFQLSHEISPEDVNKYIARFDANYFPITLEEHLELLRKIGFRIVELLWYSYMQAGFYCIK